MRRLGDAGFALGRGKALLLVSICAALPLSACGGGGNEDDFTASTSGNRFSSNKQAKVSDSATGDTDVSTGDGPTKANKTSGTDVSTGDGPTKAQYTHDADAICLGGADQTEAAVHVFQMRTAGDDLESENAEFARGKLIPILESQTKELEALDPPSASAQEVDAILDAFEEGITAAEQDPASLATESMLVSSSPAAFAKANKLAAKYGMKACMTKSDENARASQVAKFFPALETSSITKKEFVKKANEICGEANRNYLAAVNGYLRKHKVTDMTKAQSELLYERFQLPALKQQTREIVELGVPSDKSKEFRKAIVFLESVVQRLETAEDPTSVSSNINTSHAIFEAYGVKNCPAQ